MYRYLLLRYIHYFDRPAEFYILCLHHLLCPEKFLETTFFTLRSTQMKTIVRAFVIALVLTGAVASAHTSSASTTPQLAVSSWPLPQCSPAETCPEASDLQ